MRARGGLALSLILGMIAAVPAARAADDTAQQAVVGGSPTTISQYPWQAAVANVGSGSAFGRRFCGGVVVTGRIVLTAAHCLLSDPDCFDPDSASACNAGNDPGGDGTARIDPNDVSVILGRTTLSSSQGAEHAVTDVSVDPSFNPVTIANDLGYLVLSAPTAQPSIDIAGPGEAALWAPGAQTTTTGWGSTTGARTSGFSDTLQVATVPVVPDSTCSSYYGTYWDPARMVCAGGGSVNPCYGDSGGPLQAPAQGGIHRLVGLTSWGYGCTPNPIVYVRVAGALLRDRIVAKASSLETTYGIPHENLIGSGAQPPSPSGTQAPSAEVVDPFKKCRKKRTKLKRKRCIKKVKRQLRG